MLIVDPNTFYGEAGATHSLPEFRSWLEFQAHNQGLQDNSDQEASTKIDLVKSEPTEVNLKAKACSRIRAVDAWFKEDEGKGGKFCIDLAHQVWSAWFCIIEQPAIKYLQFRHFISQNHECMIQGFKLLLGMEAQ